MKRPARNVALFLVLGWGLRLAAQEVQVSCGPDQEELVFGEPVYATYRIANVSSRPVYLCAVPEPSGTLTVLRWKARAHGPWERVPVREDVGQPQARYRLEAGREVQIHQPLPVTDVTLPELPPGPYELRFTLSYSLHGEGNAWEKEASCTSSFRVRPPQGDDEAWLEALEKAARTAERARLRRTFPDAPLGWYEVLEGTVDGIIPHLLTRFPTSTYAGYVLVSPPASMAASFGCSSYDCFENAEAALRAECDRGGGEEVIGKCVREERQRMALYVQAASAFLEAHPDFNESAWIRRRLAYCLAFTNRLSEAMTQLKILAEGQGPLADEARAYLEAKARK